MTTRSGVESCQVELPSSVCSVVSGTGTWACTGPQVARSLACAKSGGSAASLTERSATLPSRSPASGSARPVHAASAKATSAVSVARLAKRALGREQPFGDLFDIARLDLALVRLHHV